MGVSGCGKSSVAKAIANEYGYEFIEADDYHSLENRQWMASGNPLTDAMREPWIELLVSHLAKLANADQSCVMSFSGLRREHRARIRDLPFTALFLHLEGDQQLVLTRINARKGHFMPASLLQSQYATLEDPRAEPNTFNIDINQSLAAVISRALQITRDTI